MAYTEVGHDRRLEPSVEIHSCWGTFEWLLHDGFRLGYRVGVVCHSEYSRLVDSANGCAFSAFRTREGP